MNKTYWILGIHEEVSTSGLTECVDEKVGLLYLCQSMLMCKNIVVTHRKLSRFRDCFWESKIIQLIVNAGLFLETVISWERRMRIITFSMFILITPFISLLQCVWRSNLYRSNRGKRRKFQVCIRGRILALNNSEIKNYGLNWLIDFFLLIIFGSMSRSFSFTGFLLQSLFP